MVIAGPILIYVVRGAVDWVFEYRSDGTQVYLDNLYKQRDETIEKLKSATKYNSTQQLLEKYASDDYSSKSSPSTRRQRSPRKQKDKDNKDKDKGDKKQQQQQQQQKQSPATTSQSWTFTPPPPTANIRYPARSADASPSQLSSTPNLSPSSSSSSPLQQRPTDTPNFAPNAFQSTQPPPSFPLPIPQSPYIEQSSHWYDRLLDVLLGEDETQPKNRLVLLCSTCRLVNGQAPPGVKTPEELGRWRCFNCGAWNGEEDVASKVVADIRKNRSKNEVVEQKTRGGSDADVSSNNATSSENVQEEEEEREEQEQEREQEPDEEEEEEVPQPELEPPKKSKYRRPRGSKK